MELRPPAIGDKPAPPSPAQIFRDYKEEAAWMLDYYETHHERLTPCDMRRIADKMERLEALIELYSELKIARRS